MSSLLVCPNQYEFQFFNNIYINNQDLIMANPLSPLLAEFFMDDIEKVIHNNPLSKYFIYGIKLLISAPISVQSDFSSLFYATPVI